jgi:hypothetical protein
MGAHVEALKCVIKAIQAKNSPTLETEMMLIKIRSYVFKFVKGYGVSLWIL